MKKTISLFGLIYSIILLVSFYQPKDFTDPFIVSKHFFLAFSGLICILAPLVHYAVHKYKLTFSVTLIDIIIFLYFSYITVHLFVARINPFMELRWIDLLILVVIYSLYKFVFHVNHPWNSSNKLLITIIVVLMLIGISHSLLGLGQYFGVLKNIQPEFRITSTFGNPGPLANYLVALLPFSLVFAFFYSKGIIKYIAILSSALILIVLPFTAARTAWIAALVVLGYTLIHSEYIAGVWNKYFFSLTRKAFLFSVVVLIVVSGVFALSSYKQDSASGRLFIWKVSLQMIKDKPLFGHGFATFPVIHNNYQADYFRANPNDWTNAFLADGVNYAFNEYIQLASEVGIIGLILFLLIPFVVYRNKIRSSIKDVSLIVIAAEGAILAILISSLFSYPLQNVPVLTVLFFSLTIISANSPKLHYSFTTNSGQRKLLLLLAIILGFIFFTSELNRFRAEKEWKEAFHLVRKGKYEKAQSLYSHLYPRLQYNHFFLFNYGAELTVMKQFSKSIQILEEVEHRLNDSDFYIYMGSSCEGVGDNQRALKCFEQASMIMPIKFYPKYRMVLLYKKLGNQVGAMEMAQDILDMPIKVESEIVNSIKLEMKEFLHKTNI